MDFKFQMSLAELKKRTSKRYYKGVKFLKRDSREVKKLSKNDLLVLMHLTRAANKLESVNLKLGHPKNLEFLEFLNREEKAGNPKAALAKKLFLSQKSMFSPDALGEQTRLAKNISEPDGLGYFPEDLEACEFHKIISDMLDAGEDKQVAEILNQRSIVVRDGDKLKAIDFVNAFSEFQEMADELEKAIEFSDDKKFNKYLELQIKALRTADPMLDAKADKEWAKLSGGKFEFTIARECYDERLTKSIYENDELMAKLKAKNITVYAKDSLGARVGIVNKSGTKLLRKLKRLIDVSAKLMPYANEYERANEKDDIPQTAVDVDLVTLTGEEGAYRASLVLAQNLPNDDKPALKIGGGRRNVYHRQVRSNSNKKLYKNLIHEEQFKYFNPEADHWAVICQENTHSLGPQTHSGLGKFSFIIEEYKADMGMYCFLREFVKEGYFTETQAKQIIVTSLAYGFLKGKPSLSQAHRTRSVMICNRMLTEKAIEIRDGKLWFDFDKVIDTAKEMMKEAIRLQLDANVKNAENYIMKWFVWSEDISFIAEVIKKFSKKLNGYIIQELADEMLSPDFEKTLED
jgi:hypothetical protein